jgi:hypothetical protein
MADENLKRSKEIPIRGADGAELAEDDEILRTRKKRKTPLPLTLIGDKKSQISESNIENDEGIYIYIYMYIIIYL